MMLMTADKTRDKTQVTQLLTQENYIKKQKLLPLLHLQGSNRFKNLMIYNQICLKVEN